MVHTHPGNSTRFSDADWWLIVGSGMKNFYMGSEHKDSNIYKLSLFGDVNNPKVVGDF